jgi:basic membrane lipoprotein Med (substrate-binding protein (PBP1-ABC) superfamily)/class 3 adenylate cyclase
MRDEAGPNDASRAREATSQRSTALRTFLIADVRGYTRFTHERGDEEAAKLAARFAFLARRGITDYAGELLELRGDEALGVFGSARDALRAAVELQRLFRGGTDEAGIELGVGIGIDAGEAVAVEGGYRGGALNLAARLCSRAAPGEILASETVVSLAGRVEGIRFEHRAPERLKGLDDAVTIVEVVPEAPLHPLRRVRLASVRRFRRRQLTRRNAVAGALVALIAAATSAAVLATSVRSDGSPSEGSGTRVGLVLPRQPSTSDDVFAPYVDGVLQAARLQGLETETLIVPERTIADSVRSRLGELDLVLLAGPGVHDAFVEEVPRHADTHFVFLDPHPNFDETQVNTLPNSTDIFFIEGPAAYLAGYMGALMEKRRRGTRGSVVVSIVAGDELVNENLVDGFTEGARAAVRDAVVLTNFSGAFADPSPCESAANRQIDRGSGVVFAAAGSCGLGALAAASLRGVWGVGVDADRSYLGPHVLVSVVKRIDRAVEFVIRSYLDGTLAAGSLDIGIEREAVGIVGISREVPADVRRRVANVKEQRRELWASWASP